MGCCRLETSKPQNTRVPWQNVAFYLDVVALETSKLIDLWFYVISKTSKPQKMKNCCELLSKLLQSLDLKNLKTIRLMWPQLQTKNLKTAGLLWPELKMGSSKLQNFWISVAPAANQKLKTSKQLGYCEIKTSKLQNTWIILAPAAFPNFRHFKIYSTIWSLWPILKNSKPAARLWP